MKSTLPRDVVILSAKRTAIGTFGGALKDVSATALGVHASKAALAQAEVQPDLIDRVIVGNVIQTSADAIYLARHIGLHCGVPIDRPSYVVNMLCGSGFQAIVNAAQEILTGRGQVMLAAGTESMSQAPHVIRGARWGIPLGKGGLEDSLWSALTDSYTGMPMGITAENLAEQYELDQDTVDEYSLRTQKAWAAANEAGRFKDEIAPMELPGRKRGETVIFDTDEHPRPQTTLEGLKKLPKVFKKDGVVHAGAASGICDGAAAMVLADAEWAKANGKKPIARVLGWHAVGVDPTIMGIGPVPAIRGILEQTGSSIDDWDLVEINEAFAPQYLACEKALGVNREKSNVDGGAIAVGHPLGATGTRVSVHLVYALRARGKRFGIASACIGGGQGIAIALEVL
jgi:acetyl-CoA acyltransferase 2